MIRLIALSLALHVLLLPSGRALAADAGPEFREIYELLRTNLTGTTEAELNQAAVNGLLGELRGRASLVGVMGDSTNPAVARFSVFDRSVAVARVGQFDSRLAPALVANFSAVTATNKVKGLVIDLRFVAADDYAAAARVAELFVAKDSGLLDWGTGLVKATAEKPAIEVPVAVLVNRETLGAPEALAAVLRETGRALVIGNASAGRALAGQEFALAGGRRLRVAVTPVKLADGTTIPTEGLKPDITVAVTLEQEKAFLAQPFASLMTNAGSTNAPSSRPARSRRLSEADLVRERREGTNDLENPPAREAVAEKQVLSDPVLARAVDLLKGLAVIRGARS